MTLSRLDLDGIGSPVELAARLHKLEPDMPLAVPVEKLCLQLDIASIEAIDTAGFEAALIMDSNKLAGGILLASGRSRQRQRYSIGHELGHFLLPTHMPKAGRGFECSLADLHLVDPREQDHRKRIEAQANRFAAALLMPKAKIRSNLVTHLPDLGEIVRLARAFDVSKEAMARAYVGAHREPSAVLILQHGIIQRIYRDDVHFPWIEPRPSRPVPIGSFAASHRLQPAELSDPEECEADIWFSDREAKRVEVLTEQLLGQRDGYAMLMLHAELIDEDDAD